MNAMGYRWQLLVLIILVCLSATAQADDTVFGTTGVSFQPLQAAGVLNGCSLVYQAVVADHAYRDGKAVVIVGNVTVQIESKTVMLVLKIGMSDYLENGSMHFQAPTFAYLQTKTATTAQSKYVAGEPVGGFGLFVVGLDEASTRLLGELMATRAVTIGFNRRKDGLDVLVPIDLTVTAMEESAGRVARKRSDEPTNAFRQCVLGLFDQPQKSREE